MTKPSIEDLQNKIAEADAAAGMKANFLATMSHEMRTPMQTVYGFLELIELEKPAAGIMEMVKTAKSSASSLLEILDDILDFAKMDAERMELDSFEVPVRTLVSGTLEALSVKVQNNKVKLFADFDEGVPYVVIGDPKRLRQILMNLTSNALKFTKSGTITINVTAKPAAIPVPENGLALRFEVIDTGIGMPEHVCRKLFNPFTQADNTTARKFGGTGLGLSICKKLVELMHGAIGVTSKEGAGSTFWFEIPTMEVGTAASTINLPDLKGISVLSVEDHPQGAKEILRSLQSMGAAVESVPMAGPALELIRHRPFDVAVIDQGLPDGLGIDLIRAAMEVRPMMGLIMYTVRDDVGLQHTCQSLGVTYLSKPASRAGLGEAVKGAAQNRSVSHIEGSRKLLIAEDTESVRDVLGRQLKKLGVQADFVENGQQALDALATGEYGILLTDLHMPEVDGYQIVDTIRSAERANGSGHFPVVVLTADVQMAQRQVYMEHGFDECLLKPVSLAQFGRLLYRWGLVAALEEEAPPVEPPKQDGFGNPPIDVEALARQMGSSREEAKEMLQAFVSMTAATIQKIQNAWEARNMQDLSDAAHSLKGAARSACCEPLGYAASDLQDAATSGNVSWPIIGEVLKCYGAVETEAAKL